MGSSWPLHWAQPLGAKPKLIKRSSERNGSANAPPYGAVGSVGDAGCKQGPAWPCAFSEPSST
jgi:hypothetical protein